MKKLFFKELATFLQLKIQDQMKISSDPASMFPLFEKLQAFEKKKDIKTLDDLITKYNQSNKQEKFECLEATLLKSFVINTKRKVKTLTKIFRGLPRRYQRQDPSKSKLLPFFSNLFFLKKRYLLKTLYYLYANISLKEKSEIACLYETEEEKLYFTSLFDSLKLRMNNCEFTLTRISDKKKENALVLTKDKKISLKSSSKEVLQFVRSVPLFLQFIQPQIYAEDLLSKGQAKYEVIGGYGQSEQCSFSPITPFQCLGGHFLDHGLLLPEKPIECLPQDRYICSIQPEDDALVFLQFLIEKNKKSSKILKIQFLLNKSLKSLAERLLTEKHIASVDVLIDEQKILTKKVADKGLAVELIYSSNFSVDKLFYSSLEPVGIGQGFGLSYVMSYRKGFFIFEKDSNPLVLKDLMSISKSFYPLSSKINSYIEGLYQLHLLHKSKETGEYVSEDQFQESQFSDVKQGIKELVSCYADTDISSLSKAICENHSGNTSILGLIKRALIHQKHPELKNLEDKQVFSFLLGKTSFISLVKAVSSEIRHFI